MRYIANTKKNTDKAVRVMVHNSAEGIYLFAFSSHEDSDCDSDNWYEDLDEAFQFCEGHYSITRDDWKEIPDPREGCLQDWIAPMKIEIKKEDKH